jgi:cell division protein FtsL
MNEKETEVVNKIKDSKEIGWVRTLFSKIKGKVLVYVIIGAAVLITAWYLISGIAPSIIKQTDKANAKLELRIDSLNKANAQLQGQVIDLQNSQKAFYAVIKKNDSLLVINNTQLAKIKKEYNVKITAIDTYNTNQLDSFFTNRYK